MKYNLLNPIIVLVVSTSIFCGGFSQAQQYQAYDARTESDWPIIPKPFLDAVLFGIQAGFIVGVAAITGFRTNFRQNMDLQNISRGMSYGLYGGILLGWYLTANSRNGFDDPPLEQRKSAGDNSINKSVLLKPHNAPYPVITFIPVLHETAVDGFVLNIEVLKF